MKKNCMMRESKSFPDADDCIPAAAKKKFVKEANGTYAGKRLRCDESSEDMSVAYKDGREGRTMGL